MRRFIQVLFGAFLGAVSLLVSFYLGLLIRHDSPDWLTFAVSLLLVAATQWVASWAIKHRIALQLLVGVLVCLVIAYGLIFSSIPMFWEHEEAAQHGVYSITWRSDAMFLLLVAIGQGISYTIFRLRPAKRRIARDKTGGPKATTL